MKEYLQEIYDRWLAENEHQLTPSTYTTRQQAIQDPNQELASAAWKKIPAEIIQKSFRNHSKYMHFLPVSMDLKTGIYFALSTGYVRAFCPN